MKMPPNRCPSCKSENIEQGTLSEVAEGGLVYADVTCNDCGAHWMEEYRFKRIWTDKQLDKKKWK